MYVDLMLLSGGVQGPCGAEERRVPLPDPPDSARDEPAHTARAARRDAGAGREQWVWQVHRHPAPTALLRPGLGGCGESTLPLHLFLASSNFFLYLFIFLSSLFLSFSLFFSSFYFLLVVVKPPQFSAAKFSYYFCKCRNTRIFF